MSGVAFCPACGTARVEGARFCGGCGADLEPAMAPATASPEPVAPPPAGAPASPPRRRSRLGAVGAAVAVLAIAAVVVGVVALQLAGGGSAYPSVPPDPGAVALTSPPPAPPAGLADPDTPAYDPDSGFTPDAVRVLTVTVLRLSLEQYRVATGAYPADLAALYPAYAPPGPDGVPMAGPPAAADGYAYRSAGSGYTLSVELASGQAYTTSNPIGP